ncbi:MAG: DUF2924 domain-containing protein [Bacteroidales bacterium]|nr:DUF2924 domain-containing protein [Bacteroidales bacterium]
MNVSVAVELANLQRMGVPQLQAKYAEVFGEKTKSFNKAGLIKRIIWRIQALDEGGLSQRALRRAEELANENDLRLTPPKEMVPDAPVKVVQVQGDERLPPPGTIILREYKGKTLQVKVRADGFEYEGKVYGSLSAVAKVITGSHCNGFLFFRIAKGEKA